MGGNPCFDPPRGNLAKSKEKCAQLRRSEFALTDLALFWKESPKPAWLNCRCIFGAWMRPCTWQWCVIFFVIGIDYHFYDGSQFPPWKLSYHTLIYILYSFSLLNVTAFNLLHWFQSCLHIRIIWRAFRQYWYPSPTPLVFQSVCLGWSLGVSNF